MTEGHQAIAPLPTTCSGLHEGAIVLADKACDARWLRRQIEAAGAEPLPPRMRRATVAE